MSIDVARPAHLGALIAARPRIRDTIRDATIAGLLPEQPFWARLDDLVETASAAFLDTLDDSASALTCKQEPQAAEEGAAANQTRQPQIPTIAETEPRDPTSQHQDDGDGITQCPSSEEDDSTHRNFRHNSNGVVC